MFRNAFRMAASSFKLLIRSKAFIMIGLIIPIAATLFINMWAKDGVQETVKPDVVVELETMDEQIVYLSDYNCLPVKVYDRSDSEFTHALCEKLSRAGLFQIFRTDCTDTALDDIEADARLTAEKDKVGAIIILSDNKDETKLYSVGDDSRFELLRDSLELCYVNPMLPDADEAPAATYVNVSSEDDVDYYETRSFSYCLSMAALAFVLGGVMILSTILNEKQDHVYSRILLTGATRGEYLISKILLVVALSLVQTLVMAICFALFVTADIGLNVFQFSLLLLLNGLVFSFVSVCAGIFVSSIFGAVVLTFTIWSMSSLLSGCLFDLSTASELYRKIAMTLPQRWTLISATMMMHGNNDAYPLILIVTAAYLAVILVMGIIGLKLTEKE